MTDEDKFEGQSNSASKRLIEVRDPQVDALFEGDEEDRVGVLIEHLPELSLKQKVHALLLLSDEEFASFRERRKGGAEFALQQLIAKKGEMGNKEYMEARSILRDTNPRYEVEAELRRRRDGKYPPEWDEELEEDLRFKLGDGLIRMKEGKRISYEEAVEFTRFENVRLWYRNSLFPQVTKFDHPLPVDIPQIIELFRSFKDNNFDPDKPGTDVSMGDLLKVTDYYLDQESDNPESYSVHKKIHQLAGTIKELEDSIPD